jgi:hypothetical protein
MLPPSSGKKSNVIHIPEESNFITLFLFGFIKLHSCCHILLFYNAIHILGTGAPVPENWILLQLGWHSSSDGVSRREAHGLSPALSSIVRVDQPPVAQQYKSDTVVW